MKELTQWAVWVFWGILGGCAALDGRCRAWVDPDQDVIAFTAGGRQAGSTPPARPPFSFMGDDEAFLDEVSRSAFEYLWSRVDAKTGLVYDRTPGPVVSVAGVGFQLAALPIGVERGWVTREEAASRARLVLGTLLDPEARSTHRGVHFHFLDGATGRPTTAEFEVLASTADAAILHAGALVVASYFGGDIARACEAILGEADWKGFLQGEPAPHPHTLGAISLGWKPDDPGEPWGAGSLLPYHWLDAGCEGRLIAFVGACSPVASHRLSPDLYYLLRREPALTPVARDLITHTPYSGSLFTQVYAHLFIDYAAMDADDPARFGSHQRLRVDWWENSRRYAAMHRAMESATESAASPGVAEAMRRGLWGLSACDTPNGYRAFGLSPLHACQSGARFGWDESGHLGLADQGDGTLSPSSAGMTILFAPGPAIQALRGFRALTGAGGAPLCWREPKEGGFGFVSGVNLVGPRGVPWASTDTLAIDEGALLLAIENARTGLIWTLFHAHPNVQAGMERLGLTRARRAEIPPSSR